MKVCVLLAGIVSANCCVLVAQEARPDAPARKDAAKPEGEKKPARDELTMTVVTKTGAVSKRAKADQLKVFVTINGDETQKVQLDNRKKDDFELGASDTFKNLRVKVPIEEIKTIRLSVEGKDMWKCESISFQFFQNDTQSQKFKFNPGRYLSEEKEKKGFNATTHVDFKLVSKPKMAVPEAADDDDEPPPQDAEKKTSQDADKKAKK